MPVPGHPVMAAAWAAPSLQNVPTPRHRADRSLAQWVYKRSADDDFDNLVKTKRRNERQLPAIRQVRPTVSCLLGQALEIRVTRDLLHLNLKRRRLQCGHVFLIRHPTSLAICGPPHQFQVLPALLDREQPDAVPILLPSACYGEQ